METPQQTTHAASLGSYILGFILSIVLTLIPFGLLMLYQIQGQMLVSRPVLAAIFITAAIAQLLVQLFFFLHLGREQKPRWNALSAAFALFIVFVVVGGSLWIMANLEHTDVSELYTDGIVSPQHEQ